MTDFSKDFFIAVKAVGDWTLEVLAVPFGSRDSDGQWFDDRTEIWEKAFSTPLAVYQHGIKQGAKQLDEKPQVIGSSRPGSLHKEVDGWHLLIDLDSSKEISKTVMDAAWKGNLAVSSGSILHLSRLDIGGKLIQYEKNRPGRIAVWPLGEVSIWEKSNGNMQPANQYAMALPAMKAIYRAAGVRFPDIDDTHGATPEANELVEKRARIAKAKEQSKKFIKNGEKS